MRVTWNREGVPIACKHDRPRERLWYLGVAMFVLGALVYVLYLLELVTAYGQPVVALAKVAVGCSCFVMAWYMHVGSRTLDRESGDIAATAESLLTSADEHSIEVPRPPRDDLGQMTNAQLKAWAYRVDRQLKEFVG